MMLFDESHQQAKVLACHYAEQVESSLFLQFVLNEKSIENEQDAKKLIEAFWLITDKAIEDNAQGCVVEGIENSEFWMYKLFNIFDGYMAQTAFNKIWNDSLRDR